ncbi:MAG: glycerol-3-phosphate dehydrogenase subunit GlpB [Chloroflexi bacterium]|nr:glycerol-3-phosphate dehydrogenase subunit GlpB [Chloroflexota bacterium]
MLDLLVIGAGLSGLMAAYTAASAGLRVKVVAKGLGALHWGAGTIDLLGYWGDKGVQRPFSTIPQLPPNHPYQLMGAEAITSALAEFMALSDKLGLSYGRENGPGMMRMDTDGENLWLPSPVGATRPAFLAPMGQIAGDLRYEHHMLIVGFTGMRDFYPQLIVENLNKQGHTARAAFLPLDTISDRRDNTAVSFASQLDIHKNRQKLARVLKKIAKPWERIGLPAILGLDYHPHVILDLVGGTGADVFEIPTLPPSVPGMRLFRALRNKLREMGVRVETGMEVINHQSSIVNRQSSIEWVATETSARPLKHRARHFLLATGGILGGGLAGEMNGRVRETIFNLPVTAPQKRNDWFRASFLDPQGHPVFAGGVAVGADFRPINGDGQPIYNNLWAAGGLLAHSDPIRERSLEGTAVATGIMAGKAIRDAG